MVLFLFATKIFLHITTTTENPTKNPEKTQERTHQCLEVAEDSVVGVDDDLPCIKSRFLW